MRPDIERAPAPRARAQSNSLDGDNLQDSRPKRKLTQLEKIAELLYERDVVCGTEFLEAHLPRYSARIHELRRKSGWQISREVCTRHPWHETVQYAYRLESLPFPPSGGG